MAREVIARAKNKYKDYLVAKDQLERAKKLHNDPLFAPIFCPEFNRLHPENHEGVEKLNQSLQEIALDLDTIDETLVYMANDYEAYINKALSIILEIQEQIQREQLRLEDFNLLCNTLTDFNNVKEIVERDFLNTSQYSVIDGFYCAQVQSQEKVPVEILSIDGNGFEGNAHKKEVEVDTSNRSFITDESLETFYEYSRIVCSSSEKTISSLMTTEDLEAECTMKFQVAGQTNHVAIKSNSMDFKIKDVFVSNNGNDFESVMTDPIVITRNIDSKCYDPNVHFGNKGIVTFHPAQYVNIALQSGYETNEDIYLYRHEEDPGTWLRSAKRYIIQINQIDFLRNKYSGNSIIKTCNLVQNPVTSIALLCKEIIPKHFDSNKQWVRYKLEINGVEHEIQPLNSHKNGTKIIKKFDGAAEDTATTLYIEEHIKNAYLSIEINSPGPDDTPLIGDLKIVLGDN